MSDFSSDLNTEKLSEIQSAIQRLEAEIDQIGGDIDEAKGDIDRLETIEFFDRGEESRQVIVHWLEDVDGETIVSLGDARDAFVEFSELRAEDDKKHNVSHGDVLVIGGSCPWYAICAKVDIKEGEDAGFQNADPFEPPVAGTEEENNQPYKEFIVWGGCGNEGGDPGGGDGCVGTPTSISISTALAETSGGVGPSIKVTEIVPDPNAPDPPEEFQFNSGLSDFTIVEDPDATAESGTSFLAFDDSDIDACWGDSGNELCGIKAGLVITELEKKLHKINAQPIEQKKVTIYPQELTTKNYTSQTGTITVGTANISSDECGNLSSDGGGGGGGGGTTTFGLATLVQGVVETPKPADLLDIEDVPLADIPKVSIGNLTMPTDFSKISIEDSDDPIRSFIDGKKAFIPMLSPDACPETAMIPVVTSLNFSLTKGECDSDGCQEITLSIQPLTTDLTFKCGLLTSHGDETQGDNPALTETFKVSCGCNEDNSNPGNCDQPVNGTKTVVYTPDAGNNAQFDETLTFTLTAFPEQCKYINNAENLVITVQGNDLLLSGGGHMNSFPVSGNNGVYIAQTGIIDNFYNVTVQ
jgi:hypothetical protein